MKNLLFLLRSYPDIDHIVPLIYKCLEEGDRAYVLFDLPYNYEKDYRIQFLMQFPRFTILHLWGVESKKLWVRILSRFVMTDRRIETLLKKHQIEAFFCECGLGIIKKSFMLKMALSEMKAWRKEGFVKGAGMRTFLRRFFRPFFLSFTLRLRLIRVAKRNSIPVFALPHAVYTKLRFDYSPRIRLALRENNGKIANADMNTFDCFVFPSELHRQFFLKYSPLRPEIAKTWGSLRFCHEWIEIIKANCPKASLPPKQNARVLFFLPKWHNYVDEGKTLELLKSLAIRSDIELVLKAHPRKEISGLDDSFVSELTKNPHVFLAPNDHSTSLVMNSDVVIDIGTGMAIDALAQNKHLIYPAYLHTTRLVFDEYGGCFTAQSEKEVHTYLDNILKKGARSSDSEAQEILKQIVYCDREPFDVLAYYYDQIQKFIKRGGQGHITQ